MTQKQGKFVVIDTTLTKTDATLVDELSGRQGDNGRVVYFALKDGNLPHNIDGQDVKLSVKDASGKVKVLTGIYDRINVTAGLFSMLIPAEFYQAAGDVEEAYLSVIDNAGTTISSIPITFTVFANGVIISASSSKDYIDTVQNFLDEFNKRITTTSNNLETVRTAVNSLNDAITNYTDLVNTKAVAVKTSTNEFTENNTFDKDITVKGAIHGNADSATKLQTPRKINGTNFDGTADINVNTFMDGVTINGKNVVNGLTDTDWLDIPLAAGRTGIAKYKVSLGKVFVHIDGVVGVTAEGNNAQGQIGTLPVNPSPYYSRYAVQSGSKIMGITIAPNGVIYVANSAKNTMSENDNYFLDTVLM